MVHKNKSGLSLTVNSSILLDQTKRLAVHLRGRAQSQSLDDLTWKLQCITQSNDIAHAYIGLFASWFN